MFGTVGGEEDDGIEDSRIVFEDIGDEGGTAVAQGPSLFVDTRSGRVGRVQDGTVMSPDHGTTEPDASDKFYDADGEGENVDDDIGDDLFRESLGEKIKWTATAAVSFGPGGRRIPII